MKVGVDGIEIAGRISLLRGDCDCVVIFDDGDESCLNIICCNRDVEGFVFERLDEARIGGDLPLKKVVFGETSLVLPAKPLLWVPKPLSGKEEFWLRSMCVKLRASGYIDFRAQGRRFMMPLPVPSPQSEIA